MKYLKLFENFKDIDSLCKEYSIKNYTIGSDGFVDVDGEVYLSDRGLDELPIKFGRVGDFICYNNKLTSLEGCPKEVGYFTCSHNNLTSLEGCPEEVGDSFVCSWNKLTSLVGGPKWVDGSFECFYNLLTIIDYLPERIERNIYFGNNKIRDIKVENKNYRFFGKCDLEENPINDLFKYWEGDLKNFILELEFEDFIRDDGKSLDITRFEYALDGKKYKEEDIKNYKLIYKV